MRRIAVLQLIAACVLLAALATSSAAERLPRQAPKLSSALAGIAREHEARALAAARSAGQDVVGGRVAVEVEAADDRRGALAAVRRAGGSVVHAYGRRATVLVSPARLDAVAAAASVRAVRERSRPFFDALPGEGVAATGAPHWHAAGWTGRGVKLGVIDGGFAGYRARQASGDLPKDLEVADFCALSRFEGMEHGTAVAEIIHEMAPGARLYLICIDDGVGLGEAIAFARANGIQIVNHSAAWFNTWRGDGTGPRESPEGVAATAHAAGMLWVNSAGNYARAHWAGRFKETSWGRHEFAAGDTGNTFVLEPRTEACVFLKWDDWPVTTQDFDLFVYRERGNVGIAAAIDEQSGQEEPREHTCFSFDGDTPEPFSVVVQRKSGFGTPRLDVFVPGRRLQYQTAAGSLGEPASSPVTLAVGAVCWQTNEVEPYTSQGPTIDGRRKPEISGPDSVSSATFGAFAECGAHVGFPGTSASSPHVAAAAALVKQARPAWTAEQISSFLLRRTADVGVPGRDSQSGVGRLALGEPLGAEASGRALRPPRLVALPRIGGVLAPGRKIRAKPGRWQGTGPLVYTYVWLRCTVDGARCAKSGVTGATYAVSRADADFTFRLAVTARNAAASRTAISRATDPVPGAYSAEPGDDLVMYAFQATSSPPPGGLVEARSYVARIDGTSVMGATVRCSATLRGRPLRVAARSFSNGSVRCVWQLPANSAGACVYGAVVVTATGRSIRRAFSVRVVR